MECWINRITGMIQQNLFLHSYVSKYLWVPIEHFYLFLVLNSLLICGINWATFWNEERAMDSTKEWLETDGENLCPKTCGSPSCFLFCFSNCTIRLSLSKCYMPVVMMVVLLNGTSSSVHKTLAWEGCLLLMFLLQVFPFKKKMVLPCIYFTTCFFLKAARKWQK